MSRRLAALVFVFALGWACADPPDKEMHQAQGAIDAAKAAGAEQYAPKELAAATTALERAHQAVTDGDYRLALSQALDARESATAAARTAADQKADTRSETERTLGALDTAIARAEARLKTARTVRAAAAAAETLETQLVAAKDAVQKARSALASEDYLRARDALKGTLDALNAALDAVDSVLSPRRRR